jgi:hypothetical protein
VEYISGVYQYQYILYRIQWSVPVECHFDYTEIEYVGKVISENGLKMSQEKIRSVLDSPIPSVSKQLNAS